MKLGLQLGYWSRTPPVGLIPLVQEAEKLGFDSIWVAESWGNDAFTYGAWIAAHTARVRIGTGIVQLAARTPTATAMAAVTLDHLSGGRLVLGLGVSGPQVVEGWYGAPSHRPLARTREYVEVLRRVFARADPLDFQGEFYQFPYGGPGSVGLGKPLKIMAHPLRADLPIVLAAEGPKNVAQTVAIADGWLPLYYSPYRQEVYSAQLAGMTEKPGFEVNALVHVAITDDIAAGLVPVKAMLGFYIGGMGAKGQNYHTALMARMGFEEAAHQIQDLFFQGRREEAIAAVPDEFADEISLVGPAARIRERLAAWRSSPVTTLLITERNPDKLGEIAALIGD